MPGQPSPISIVVLADVVAARARWAAFDTVSVVTVHTSGRRPTPASTVVLDLLDVTDPVGAARDAVLHPREEVVVLVGERQVPALRAAGFPAVVTTPQLAVLRAITMAATAALHDGPIQSLTVARLQLSLATARRDDEVADSLQDLDAALSAAADDLAGVLDALRTTALNDAWSSGVPHPSGAPS